MAARLALVLTLAAAWGPAAGLAEEKEPVAQVELKKGDHILFYGDSLTEQARGPKGWVTIVRDTLKEKHPDLGLEVSTFAIGGYCIVDRVKRVEKEVLAKKPTIVVIQGGVPDALRYKRDAFKTGLEELIDLLQMANVRVVVCSCTSLGEKHDGSNRVDGNLDEFAEVARLVAKDKMLPLNDLRKVFKDYWKKNNPDNKASGILTHDGNHFNETGNKFVAEQMLKMFKSAEKQNKPAPRKAAPAPEQFDSLTRLILPDAQRGETKWLDVEWMTNTLEARKKAAAENKPIVVWTMSACPLGGD